jgi:hypothetical protein
MDDWISVGADWDGEKCEPTPSEDDVCFGKLRI